MARHTTDTDPDVTPLATPGLTLDRVRTVLFAEVWSAFDPSQRVESVGAADLMSDVLALSRPGMLLLTGLNSVQAVHTAALADLAGIVLVRGKQPGDDVVALARERRVPILSTRLTMFEAAGRLYAAVPGARGGSSE